MYIATRDSDRYYVFTSILDRNKGKSVVDLFDEDNLACWTVKNKHGRYFVVVDETSLATDVMRYDKDLFNMDINDETISCEFVPRLVRLLRSYGIVNSDGRWFNKMLIFTGNDCYEIDGRFTISKNRQTCLSIAYCDMLEGFIERDKSPSGVERITNTMRFASRVMAYNVFPLAIYDTSTGKRKIIYK